MLQQVVVNTREIDEKVESLSRKREDIRKVGYY